MLKQIEPKRITLGEVEFAIFPFGAMKAANLSGKLGKFFGPIVTGLLPLAAGDGDVLEMDLKAVMPMITGAFAALDGDVVESLLKELLINGRNVTCRYQDENGRLVQSVLNLELVDEIFCQNVEELYRLAFEVINVNYSGFFGKLLTQSGNLKGNIRGLMNQKNTENLMEDGSAF